LRHNLFKHELGGICIDLRIEQLMLVLGRHLGNRLFLIIVLIVFICLF